LLLSADRYRGFAARLPRHDAHAGARIWKNKPGPREHGPGMGERR